MAAEGVFPKVDGDILYASEINDLYNNKYRLIIQNTIPVVATSLSNAGNSHVAVTDIQEMTISIPAGEVTRYINISSLLYGVAYETYDTSTHANSNIKVRVYKTYNLVDTELISQFNWLQMPIPNSGSVAGSTTIPFYYEPTQAEMDNGFDIKIEATTFADSLSGETSSATATIKYTQIMGI